MNVPVVVAVLPHSSAAVNITVTDAEQSSAIAVKLLVHVTAEQLSVADAPPFEASHAFNSAMFPEPLHSTVILEAATEITGGVTSSTVIVCDAVAVFPHASIAVHVLVISYAPAHARAIFESENVKFTVPPQLSVAVGSAKTGTAGHSIVVGPGTTEMTGGTVSFTVIVCKTELVLEQASVNVQVRTIVNEFTQLPGVTVSTPATVIVPAQLSVAVSEIIAGTSEAQVALTFAGAAGATGAVESWTVNVAEVVDALPHASVAVKITVTAVEQSFASALKLFVQVTSEQVSEATAPPLLASQFWIAVWFPVPSHSTVRFEACVVIVGAVTS